MKENFRAGGEVSLIEKLLADVDRRPSEERAAMLKELIETVGVQVQYTQSSEEGFPDMRHRLNTEAGILIANHPSVLDPFIIFKALTRSDVLVMIHGKAASFFEKVLDSNHIVTPPGSKTDFRLMTEKVTAHIANGGLFIMFPSGVNEIQAGSSKFKSGFRLLVSEINPESMIYSFYIDPHIGEALRPLKGDNQQTSSENIMVFPDLHVRRQDNLEVRVNENYSQASDWPDTSTLGASIDEKNDEMTKYFLNRVGP